MFFKYIRLLVICFILLLPTLSMADILVDGRFDDWEEGPVFVDDSGDGVNNSIDFTDVYINQQYGYLIFRIPLDIEVLLQDDSDITLYIDTDNNINTGALANSIGADLIWNFGDKSGTIYLPSGSSVNFEQGEIGTVSAPTVTSTEFEISFDLSARIANNPVFGFDEIKFAFRHSVLSGDRIPNEGGILFELETNDETPIQLPVVKQYDDAVRLVTWNVLFDGIVERPESFERILQAIQPDMIVFEEVWSTTAFEIAQLMNEWLPMESSWTASKQSADVILASRWPILESWDVPEARATAFLVQTPDTFDDPFFIIGAHPPAGNNNQGRQYEIDAIMEFLREAKEEGGDVEIEYNTPIIITGDMNLVGYSEQLTTLLEGEIVNQNDFGPSFEPDWDDSPMLDLFPRHPSEMFVYSWRNPGSSWAPGKLDYIILSDSNIRSVQSFVLDSKTLSDGLRMDLGLHINDSETASDHIPVVADLVPLDWNSVPEPEDTASLPGPKWVISPNPFNPSLTVTVDLEKSGFLEVGVYDILGRQVAELSRKQVTSGRHQFFWDASATVRSTASGTYFIRLVFDKSFTECRKAILLK